MLNRIPFLLPEDRVVVERGLCLPLEEPAVLACMSAAGIAILCSRCCSAWRCQQSRPGEDTSCTVVVDSPRRSDPLQYATALATASAHSRAVSSTAAPTPSSPLGASSCCCFVLGTCVRERHSSFLAPKHSGPGRYEAEVVGARRGG
jgi:hypothetical protein